MSIRDYLTKIHIHLQDHSTYKPVTLNPTNAIAHDACTLIYYMHSRDIIDMVTMEILVPPRNTRTPLFYGLPKIHKLNCPLLPITSRCNGPTDHISSYITHFTQPLAKNVLSHIKDTKHFLNLICFHAQLEILMILVNTIKPTIKYTFTYSKQTVSVLDVQVYLSEFRKRKTNFYKNSTDCMTLLQFHYHHPLSCKEGIIYS